MKKPDEIKKTLYQCGRGEFRCSECAYYDESEKRGGCGYVLQLHAFAYIEQLERERDQYKRERDAAIIELRGYGCEQCVHSDLKNIATVCCNCKLGSLWEWQGVKQHENR